MRIEQAIQNYLEKNVWVKIPTTKWVSFKR